MPPFILRASFNFNRSASPHVALLRDGNNRSIEQPMHPKTRRQRPEFEFAITLTQKVQEG